MAQWLKQNTAATIPFGPFLDETDGKTLLTALTISQADIRISKNGGTFAQSNNSAGAAHQENGVYGVPLDSTDTNTLGRIRVEIHETGALAVWQDFMVVPANVWDSMFGADRLDVNVEEWNATTVPAEHTAGYPVVTVKDGTGTGEIDTLSGKVLLRDGAITATVFATASITADAIDPAAIIISELSVGALSDIVDSVLGEIVPELAQAAPPDTPTVKELLMLLYMAFCNELVVTTSEQRIKNAAGTVIAKAALNSTGGVFTRDKLVSGP